MKKTLEFKKLTAADIRQIHMDTKNGDANRLDIISIINIFCYPDAGDQKAYLEAVKFLRKRLSVFIQENTSIEKALGLSKKKGRPKSDEQTQIEMAVSILKMRLKGLDHQAAVDGTSKIFGWGKTQVEIAWKTMKMDGLLMLRHKRGYDSFPWSDKEITQLSKIFKKEKKWFI